MQLLIILRLLSSNDKHLHFCMRKALCSLGFTCSVSIYLATASSFGAACALGAAEECCPALNDVICMFAGDLARWLEDGTIQILGRIDRQVMSISILLHSVIMSGLGVFWDQP